MPQELSRHKLNYLSKLGKAKAAFRAIPGRLLVSLSRNF